MTQRPTVGRYAFHGGDHGPLDGCTSGRITSFLNIIFETMLLNYIRQKGLEGRSPNSKYPGWKRVRREPLAQGRT